MAAHRRARLYRGSKRNLMRLARMLRRGELVAVPTETVYGLAADASNPRACRAIFTAKRRPTNDPLIVHVHSLRQVEEIAHVSPEAKALAKAFWPGPLTLVLPKTDAVPEIVTSGLPSVAVRMPRHPLFRKLLKLADRPLAAPSANPFGYVSPTTADHVLEGLGERIKAILDGGPCEIGLESTIVDLRNPLQPAILRPGAVSAEDIGQVLSRHVATAAKKTAMPSTRAAVAPGMLKRHYSPRKPLVLSARISPSSAARTPDEAFVALQRPSRQNLPKNFFWLGTSPDLATAARQLFSVLRTLDGASWRRIHVQTAPGRSALAVAINDRLRRAAAR